MQVATPNNEVRFSCLDMCELRPAPAGSPRPPETEDAILLEIWRSGGLFQTLSPIAKDSTVTIMTSDGPIEGNVDSCLQDDYGFLIEVRVRIPRLWFPRAYRPACLMPPSRVAA